MHVTLQRTGPPAFRRVWASPLASRLANTSGRIEFTSRFGLVVHLLLLSTWPRGHAVTFGYGPENVCPERTCTSLIQYTLERTSPPFQRWVDGIAINMESVRDD